CWDAISPLVSAKSRDTPLSAATTRKCPNRVAGGKPRIPVRNAADRCWSRQETMVWFSCTLTLSILPAPRRCEQPAGSRPQRADAAPEGRQRQMVVVLQRQAAVIRCGHGSLRPVG